MQKTPVLKVEKLNKIYKNGESTLQVLKEVDLTIYQGEFTFIIGASGSGKSSLLQIMGGLDKANSGLVDVCGQDLSCMTDESLAAFRRKNMGFVFQFFNLLENLNAIENVALPLMLDGVSWKEASDKAKKLLVEFGLQERLHHYPYQLSGGQMQRVAVCRAIVAKPSLLLADEPTGNLDSKSARDLLSLFRKLSNEDGQTIVMVTHDMSLIDMGHRVIDIKDGQIEDDRRVEKG
ncbi:MAG: ABC transporter ATP-binding protein [Bdellovibrionales bacterium]|nr:ABC transporter ATP-binding protein [Bdellovibrionales bacterium]